MSRFVICINNGSNPASLILGKVCRTLPDASAEAWAETMDFTDVSPERMKLAIERFVAGDSLSYHGVGFRLDNRRNPPRLEVSSWSDWIYLENVQREEAKEKIERSKQVAEDLAEKSAEFRRLWQTTVRHFTFYFDYVMSGRLLAEELDGEIVWRGD